MSEAQREKGGAEVETFNITYNTNTTVAPPPLPPPPRPSPPCSSPLLVQTHILSLCLSSSLACRLSGSQIISSLVCYQQPGVLSAAGVFMGSTNVDTVNHKAIGVKGAQYRPDLLLNRSKVSYKASPSQCACDLDDE